ncbi:MAG: 1-deoxy-D-xylulose-5-phosphate reductoisomerase [Chloroflexi bacterium]|nr:1-deoxy-D-xylulose-5-phosphate reductoisomerase [Chloroflexota bacterium]
MAHPMRRVAVLGSTGSVGTQTLDVIRAFPDKFDVVALSAGKNLGLLAQQIDEFNPEYVLCEDSEALKSLPGRDCGSLEEMATLPEVDVVMVSTVGSAGLLPTVRALEAGKSVALANKEVLIMAGEQVMDASRRFNNQILPVDSEPSAIWQCMLGERDAVRKLIITASGGAFRDRSPTELGNVTPEEALNHPTWSMGRKITIDSATLVNKAFEVIEAHWLFDMPYDKIDVVIHRQSIVHSMIETADGIVKAHLGSPDMRYPIQYALSHPQRVFNPGLKPFDPVETGSLTFEAMDPQLYPCFELAIDVGRRPGTWGAALMGADEAAVEMFLENRIKFTEIPDVIRAVVDQHTPKDSTNLPNLDEVIQTARWASDTARATVVGSSN